MEKLAALQELSARQTNITPIKASDSSANLPGLTDRALPKYGDTPYLPFEE